MNWSLSLVLFAGIPVQPQIKITKEHFKNYHEAHRIARQSQKPLLMILGEGVHSSVTSVSLSKVRKTAERRRLLNDYVVVVIDTTTPHGRTVHKAYENPKLPHVVVLDKRQEYQIFTTSEILYGQRWTEILKKHRSGKRAAPTQTAAYCYT